MAQKQGVGLRATQATSKPTQAKSLKPLSDEDHIRSINHSLFKVSLAPYERQAWQVKGWADKKQCIFSHPMSCNTSPISGDRLLFAIIQNGGSVQVTDRRFWQMQHSGSTFGAFSKSCNTNRSLMKKKRMRRVKKSQSTEATMRCTGTDM